MAHSELQVLDIEADRALFAGEIQGLASLIFHNERPLSGLAGLLDWKFAGALSDYIRAGVITGEVGQCVYVPITKFNITYHVLLLGAGDTPTPGARDKIPPETLRVLQKNLAGLKLEKIGISRRDFGNSSDEHLNKQLKGCKVWIVN